MICTIHNYVSSHPSIDNCYKCDDESRNERIKIKWPAGDGYRELNHGEPLTVIRDRFTRKDQIFIKWINDGTGCLLVNQGGLEVRENPIWFVVKDTTIPVLT